MEMRKLSPNHGGKIHPPSPDITVGAPALRLSKQIRVYKDVNGVAVRDNNVILLALGQGTLGGLATLDIETERVELYQQGRPFRQIGVSSDGVIYTSTKDSIHTYNTMDELNQNSPSSVITPGPNVWGLCQTPDGQFIFGDCRQKKVHITNKQGSSLVVEKTEKNHLKSVWSLACSDDRLYISDRKKRQVVCTSLKPATTGNRGDGAYLWRQKLGRPFPKYKKAVEDMAYNYFGGLCTDLATGNIFVCDTANSKLAYITKEGVMTYYNNLDLESPAHVATNGRYVVVVDNVTLLDCVVKVYQHNQTTSL